MHNAVRQRGTRALVFAFLALMVASLANLQALPARADTSRAIDLNTIVLTNETRPGQRLYVYDTVKISAQWSIPDQSGQAGQQFTLGLPDALQGNSGTFELKGAGDQANTVFGNCTIEATRVVCTLTDAVVGKNNVGGDLWVSALANKVYSGSTLQFSLNGGATRDVPLPQGADGIGYDPWTPDKLDKMGYFNGDTLTWRVIIPGATIAGQNRLEIHDPYGVNGYDFTATNATFYSLPSTPECWNNSFDPQCRVTLWDSNNGTLGQDASFAVDDNLDKIAGTVSGPFDASKVYILHIEVEAAEPILVGSEFPNAATVNGEVAEALVTREAVGGGSGSGDTVGHIKLIKKVDGIGVSADAVFPVSYSYSQGGKDYQGTLEVGPDGSAILRNVLNGTVITLTEGTPTGTTANFGDPVFTGNGVNDGGAASRGATVTVTGSTTVEVTLTNPVEDTPKITLAEPQVTPGVCQPGSTTPTDPTVNVPATPGITYSQPNIVTANGQATITVTATPDSGKAIDEATLPTGWAMNQDGTATFTKTVDVPVCAPTPVVPQDPTVAVGVCEADALQPTDPTITEATTEGIDYTVDWALEGGQVVFTATATAKTGYAIDKDNLPTGWTWDNANQVAKFEKRVDNPVCATPVVPVTPKITPGVCVAGSTTPTDPTVELATTTGIVYSAPTFATANGEVTVTVTATREGAHYIDGGNLPAGWTYNNDGTATYTEKIAAPDCAKPATPVAPAVVPGVCEDGSETPTNPTATAVPAEGVTYGEPVIGNAVNGKFTVTLEAKTTPGYVFGDDLGEGWTRVDEFTATFSGEYSQPDCVKQIVVPVAPTVLPGVCEAGSTTPTAPTVTLAQTPNVTYGDPVVEVVDGKVKVTVVAKAEGRNKFSADRLDAGWTLNADGSATYVGEIAQPDCAKAATPAAPTVLPGVCEAGSVTPTAPTATTVAAQGITYGEPVIKVDGGKFTVTVEAKTEVGYRMADDLGEGWTRVDDFTATFSGEYSQPECIVPVTPQDPKVIPGVCKPGSESPTPPTVSVPKTPGLVYGKPKITEDGGKVKITVNVTPKPGYKIGDLGPNWKLNDDGSATYTYEGKTPACKKPGLPKTGD